MYSLLERANQAISVTDVSRQAKQLFSKLMAGDEDRYVVLRNNTPAAVMLSISEYEALIDELENARVDLLAYERLQSLNESETISHADMLKHFDVDVSESD